MDSNLEDHHSISSEPSDYFRETFDFISHKDSITRKRRRAVYIQRPYVQAFGEPNHHSRSNTLSDAAHQKSAWDAYVRERSCEHDNARYRNRSSPYHSLWFSEDDAAFRPSNTHLPFEVSDRPPISLEEERWKLRAASWLQESSHESSEESSSSKTNLCTALSQAPSPARQTKASLCTRLKFQRDVRAAIDETWAIQEGSLVICIDPKYTVLRRSDPDEFLLNFGDFFVVCRIYADRWALCARVSLAQTYHFEHMADSSIWRFTDLGFLPLCAVTMAANFSAFLERCSIHFIDPDEVPQYPGNGLPVIPPERSHSLTASKQLVGKDSPMLELPAILEEACNHVFLSGPGADFVPLDSTIRQLFFDIPRRRHRVSELRKSVSSVKFWRGSSDSDDPSFGGKRIYRLPSLRRWHSSLRERRSSRRSTRSSSSSLFSAGTKLSRLVRRST